MNITIVFGTDRQGFDNSLIKIITFAPIVKWISQSSSERLCRVRVLVGAPKSHIWGISAILVVADFYDTN